MGRTLRRFGAVPEGQPDGLGEDAALAGAEFGETVLAIYPDGPSNLYQIRHWLPTLEFVGEALPTAIVVQDSRVAAALRRDTALRVYPIARYATFEALADRGAARLALYPAHHTRNFQIMRRADLAHVYLGHGESDKAVSASNQLKAYDFTFVAGRAAIERAATLPFYAAEERCLVVGRPQVRGLVPGPRGAGEVTVLYAPTWEGGQQSMSYGSVPVLGQRLIAALLAGGYRVIYRPHPRIGISDTAHAEADAAVRRLVDHAADAQPGAGHRISRGDLIADFNAADLLITDVSSLAVDWLPTERPVLVSDLASGLEPDTPVSAALPRLRPDDDPLASVESALAAGVELEARRALVEHYLGGIGDPYTAFVAGCREVLRRHGEAMAAAAQR